MKKLLYTVYLSVFFLLFTVIDVNAEYIDPSVMTYAIQAIAGIAIGLGTFLSVYWHKIKHVIWKDQGKSKKILESDLLEFKDPNGQLKRTNMLIRSMETKAPTAKEPFLPAVLLSVAISFMLCFYCPLELYFANIDEFRFDLYSIVGHSFLLFAIVCVVILVIFYLSYTVSKKIYFGLFFLGTVVFFALYIQGNFFISDLPRTDGASVNWSDFSYQKIQSLAIWIVSFVCCGLILILFRKKVFLKLSSFVLTVIIGVLSVTLVIVSISNNGFRKKQALFFTDDYYNTFSYNKNFVVIIVDMVDSRDVMKLINSSGKEVGDSLEDFTYYPDTLGLYPYTKFAAPQILTGVGFEEESSFETYTQNALCNSPFLNLLKEKDYEIAIYEDSFFPTEKDVGKYENAIKKKYIFKSPIEFMMNELRVAFYLYMPYQLKWLEENALQLFKDQEADINCYDWTLTKNYKLTELPIELRTNNTYKFIHTEGAHMPFRYDKEINVIDNGNYSQNIQATFTFINKYITHLKEFGVYDNTVLVILSDHGFVQEGNDYPDVGRQNPLFLVKGLGEKHPFTISDTPVSYESLQSIYMNLLKGMSASKSVENKEDRVSRRYLFHSFYGTDRLTEYYLKDGFAWETDALTASGIVFQEK